MHRVFYEIQSRSSMPKVMGIINLSPLSFSEVGRCHNPDTAWKLAEAMVEQGVDIIDVGAEPTNPYRQSPITVEQEIDSLLPVVERLSKLPVPISVDTSRPDVIRAVAQCGASMINDVRALRLPGALEAVAETQLPVCLTHIANMTDEKNNEPSNSYSSHHLLLEAIICFLQDRIDACQTAGIAANQIIIDPGIGGGHFFGKNDAQNRYLLSHINELNALNCPILIGASRKTVIYNTLNIAINDTLAASLAAAVLAVAQGASIIRAHDVKETVHAVKMAMAILNENKTVTTARQTGELSEDLCRE